MNNKDVLLERISAHVFSRGNLKFTMDKIASELKISKKTIYKHFPTKHDLLDAIMFPRINFIKNQIAEIINSNKNFVEKCYLISEVLINSLQFADKLVSELAAMGDEWWNKIDKIRMRILNKNIKILLTEGIKEGYIIDRDVVILSKIYISAITSVINPTFSSKVKTSPGKLIEITLEVLFQGLFTEKGRKYFKKLKKEKLNKGKIK